VERRDAAGWSKVGAQRPRTRQYWASGRSKPADGRGRRRIQNTGYTCRTSALTIFGPGFNSRRLHHFQSLELWALYRSLDTNPRNISPTLDWLAESHFPPLKRFGVCLMPQASNVRGAGPGRACDCHICAILLPSTALPTSWCGWRSPSLSMNVPRCALAGIAAIFRQSRLASDECITLGSGIHHAPAHPAAEIPEK